MKIKEGVSLRLLKPQMCIAMIIVEQAYTKLFWGIREECTLTSGDEGKHKTGSKHPMGEALDFRTRHLKPQEKLDWKVQCERKLGDEYDVVLSRNCLHVEWDPE